MVVYPVTTRRHVTWMNVKCIGLGRGSLYMTPLLADQMLGQR